MSAAPDDHQRRRPVLAQGTVPGWQWAFGLVAAPLAWIAQLCATATLAILREQQRLIPWLIGAALLIAALALGVSWRANARAASAQQQAEPTQPRAGRTRFLTTWGLLLSSGFLVAIAASGVAQYLMLAGRST